MQQFRKGSPYIPRVGGCVVPKEFIINCSLRDIERMLGFRSSRLMQGAIFVQLDTLPTVNELEYYGDTGKPTDQFEQNKNKDISMKVLSSAAFAYFGAVSKLVKVIPLDDPYSQRSENQDWPAGFGAMQYKLKEGIKKSGTIIDVVQSYPNSIFKGI